jgi:hypothetical protein
MVNNEKGDSVKSPRFLVLKWDDIAELNEKDIIELHRIMRRIEYNRKDKGKTPRNNYVTINVDEPYILKIANVMYDGGHDVYRYLGDKMTAEQVQKMIDAKYKRDFENRIKSIPEAQIENYMICFNVDRERALKEIDEMMIEQSPEPERPAQI